MEVMNIKNKIFVKILVPEIDMSFDVYLPINKKIGNIIILLNKAISEMTQGEFASSPSNVLYNAITKEKYSPNTLLASTDIRNASTLILLS